MPKIEHKHIIALSPPQKKEFRSKKWNRVLYFFIYKPFKHFNSLIMCIYYSNKEMYFK